MLSQSNLRKEHGFVSLPGNKLEVRGKVVGQDQQDNGLL